MGRNRVTIMARSDTEMIGDNEVRVAPSPYPPGYGTVYGPFDIDQTDEL